MGRLTVSLFAINLKKQLKPSKCDFSLYLQGFERGDGFTIQVKRGCGEI